MSKFRLDFSWQSGLLSAAAFVNRVLFLDLPHLREKEKSAAADPQFCGAGITRRSKALPVMLLDRLA
jgi:hypothetical protein